MASKSYFAGAVIMAVVVVGAAFALPRFAARVEQKCNLCHISPNGGGMRNAFGAQYFAQTEMAAHTVGFEEIGRFDPQISSSLAVGADIRTLYHYNENTEQSTFFQMEGNFYLTAQLDKRFSATLNRGLYSGFEAYGLAYILPWEGYFKAGKFQPAYGWYADDHTIFVREKLLWRPGAYDTGIEFGVLPHNFSASIGVFNGSTGNFDDNKSKAVATRVELRRNIAGAGLGLGGSYYYNRRPTAKVSLYGPFYYLKSGQLVLIGEIGLLGVRSGGSDSLVMALSQELAWEIKRGYWLKAQYDFYDPNMDVKSGSLTRYSAGLHYFPIGFVEIAPLFRYYDEVDARGKHSGYFVYDGQLHFFF